MNTQIECSQYKIDDLEITSERVDGTEPEVAFMITVTNDSGTTQFCIMKQEIPGLCKYLKGLESTLK